MTQNVSNVGDMQKKQRGKKRKQNKYFKTSAKRVLLSADNHFKAVISVFITGLCGAGFFYLGTVINGFIANNLPQDGRDQYLILSYVLSGILFVLGGFFIFAFSLGTYKTLAEMTDGETEPESVKTLIPLISMLSDAKTTAKTAVLYIIFLAEISVISGLSYFLLILTDMLAVPVYITYAAKALIFVFAAAALLFCVMLLSTFPYAETDNKGAGAFRLYKKCVQTAAEGFYIYFRAFISFIPLILISLLSFGVVLFAYTIPYMMLTAAGIGEYLYKSDNLERNNINE